MAVFNEILRGEQGAPAKVPGDRHRRRELARAREEAKARAQEIGQLKRRLRRQRERTRSLESQLEARQGPEA